ncbi:MAG: type II secretion system protein [Methylophilaceae bacterium]
MNNKLMRRGFTLIELLVVMAVIALLLSMAAPKYFGRVSQSKEVILKHDLSEMREALDKFYGDTGQYPEALQDLVDRKYLRSIPSDPITETAASWVTIAPSNGTKGAVFDIKSGAPGNAADGTAYAEW